MTAAILTSETAEKILKKFPGSVIETTESAIILQGKQVFEVASYLKNTPEFNLDYLNQVTAVDYPDYFEVVYYLTSLAQNRSLILKARLNKANPVVPSVTPLWRSADLQEREIFDLMGIKFEGHPNLKRIMLWEGFNGHPLRKDWKSDARNINVG